MRRAAATLVLLPAVALTACGSHTIDSGRAEAFLNGALQPTPRTVKCPSGITSKRGRSFECSVVAADGRRYTVTVQVLDSAGHARIAEIHPR